MDTRLSSSASKRYQYGLHSRSDLLIGFEEIDGDEDTREEEEEFPCPFCSEYFDIVGLCCHIDDHHPLESKKNGLQRKRKSRKGGPYSTLSMLRKELQEGNLQFLLGNSSYLVSSSNAAPDPLLSSFILPVVDDAQTSFSSDRSTVKKSSDERTVEQNVKLSHMSIKDQEEKANRSEFIQGLLFSTIADDIS